MKTIRQLIHLLLLVVGVALLIPFAGLPFGHVSADLAERGRRKGATLNRITGNRVRAVRRPDAEAGVSLGKRRAWFAGAGTPMVRENFLTLTNMTLALTSVFYDQLTAVAEPEGVDLMSLFSVKESSNAQEVNQGVGGFGDVPEYKGTIEYDSFELLYPKTYQPTEFAKGMAVERKLLDDAQYGVINDRTALFGMSFDRKLYRDAASVFNNAFSASYPGGDGVALCSAAHPLSSSKTATQSNLDTNPLTYDNIITAEQAGFALTDSEGNPIEVNYDTLIVPGALKQTAVGIVGSSLKPGTANNDINVVGDTYQVRASRFLTDSNNWFQVDSRLAKMYLKWYWRVRPEFTADPAGDFNLVAKYRGYMRYSYGWDSWQWIFGHNVP